MQYFFAWCRPDSQYASGHPEFYSEREINVGGRRAGGEEGISAHPRHGFPERRYQTRRIGRSA
jgi:hypothetical protein